MLAALTVERIRPKLVTVVDDDIDARNPAEVEWATAYRVQADRDVVIIDRVRGVPLDPSSPEPGVGAVMVRRVRSVSHSGLARRSPVRTTSEYTIDSGGT
jgi:UbiD family decarboxylase